MAGDKRQRGSGGRGGGEDRSAKRRRYAAAAASGKNKAKAAAGEIRGPGLWLSCVRRKEAISTSEAYDLLNDVADRIYPETSKQVLEGSSKDLDDAAAEHEPEEDDIEAQIAKELEELQPTRDPVTGKKKMRFQGVRTDTECLVWISCAPPIDPIKMTYTIADELQNGAPVRTRFLQRITPVSNTTHADPNSLKRLAYRLLQPIIAPTDYTLEQREKDEPIKYRIEPILRNHTASLNRQVVTDIIGEVVRDLANPSFQFQKRKNSEEAVNGHENDEAVAEESKETPVAEEHVKEDISNPTEAASTQAMEANVQIETAVQYEEKETADSAHQLQAGRAEDPPEETPWHVLPEYRRRTFVDLKHPTHTILVSALRGVCGMSVVERYDERKKFNVQMLSGTLHVRENSKKVEADQEEHKDVQSATSLTIENTAAGQAAQQTEVEPITELQGETGNEGRKFLA